MARDPYKYFRVEARELVDELTRVVLEVGKGTADSSAVAKLLRLAHTLKGAAQVVKQTAIAALAHTAEGILAPYREGVNPVPQEGAEEVVRLLDQIAVHLKALESSGETEGMAVVSKALPEERLETVRVDVEEVEVLLAGLSEAGVQVSAIQNETGTVKRAMQMASSMVEQLASPDVRANSSGGVKVGLLAEQLLRSLVRLERSLAASVDRTERELSQAQERASRLRLLTVGTIFPSLERAVREAGTVLGKRVELQTAGGNIRLDANVLLIVRDALFHLVRNAVAHGIENEPARNLAGKPALGSIEVRVERKGRRVEFVCRDDGGGIDVAAIRRVAVKRGAIAAEAAESLALKDAIDLLLQGGVSTTSAVTGISGRGIGLDMVRDAVARLKGAISVETAPGQGTTVRISVPTSLSAVTALLVESAGQGVYLPLDAVREALRINDQEIARSGTQESIAYQDRPIPFLPLSAALGQRRARANGFERKTAVVVASGAMLAAVGVERLWGTRSVLVHSLPALAAAEAVVAGGCLDAEGHPLLMVDPAGLVAAAQRGHAADSSPAGVRRMPILVVDDSLTTRMVEQNILESAGYEVEVATSGEEALQMSHDRRYALFLVDVEMPGMDGFQFISRAREDQRDIPSVLVTSRNSADDRRRGAEAGARAYIVKSDFHQGHFLETLARLLGVANA